MCDRALTAHGALSGNISLTSLFHTPPHIAISHTTRTPNQLENTADPSIDANLRHRVQHGQHMVR